MTLLTPLTLTRKQAQELDQLAAEEYGISSLFLMENAGRSIAEYLLSQNTQGKITICCGKGNNAGDGFVVARHLNNHQIPVQVLLFAKPEDLSKDAKNIMLVFGWLEFHQLNRCIVAQSLSRLIFKIMLIYRRC